MKTKVAMKSIRNSYNNIFCAGYCELEDIMRWREATHYNCGVYGWNCDIYTNYKRDIAITTGYRNMAGTKIPHELIEKFSKIARNIMNEYTGTNYEEVRDALDRNRENFYDELLNI